LGDKYESFKETKVK